MEIKIHTGESILAYTNTLAEWRIKYFKEFPYLYDGNFDYESTYVHHYHSEKDGMILTVEDEGKIVAIATGIALLSEFDIFSSSIEALKQFVNIDTCAYLGEIIISEEYRAKGLSRKMITAQENHYKSLGYTHCCFLTVIRTNHPLQPQDYTEPSIYWHSLGYKKTNIITSYSWPTIQHDEAVIEMENEMVYWIKEI